MKINYIVLLIFCLLNLNLFSQNSFDLKLLNAADNNLKDSVLHYLDLGANANALTWEGVTPLMYASENGNVEICKLLISNGADVNILPKYGANALIAATQYNHNDVVELLILNKAKFNLKDELGYNALCYAVAYGYTDIAETLLYYGASTKLKCNNSDPMMIAAYYGDTLMIKLLFKYGADINSKDDEGFTPLMIAAQNNFFDAVVTLVNLGANINDLNNKSHSALTIATINNYSRIVDFLINSGSEYNNPDNQNFTPYTIAIINESNKCEQIFKNLDAKKSGFLVINKIVFSFLNNFNISDYMLGMDIGLQEARFNLIMYYGILVRPFHKNIVFQENEHLYYQIKEQRTNIFIGIEKNFNLVHITKYKRTGLLLGCKGILSFGEYESVYKSFDDKYLYAPYAGCFYKGKSTGIKLSYEYLKMTGITTSPHHVNISLSIYFSTNKINHSNKVLYGFCS